MPDSDSVPVRIAATRALAKRLLAISVAATILPACRGQVAGTREPPRTSLPPSPSASASASAPSPPALNARVLALIATYPDGGFGGYRWPARRGTSGTTRDLAVGDDVVATGGDGNHCVGVTLEVFWRALAECPGGVAAALDARSARAFKRTWYVPVDRGAGSAEALPAYALGDRIAALDDARPGDFMQAWRADGLGHSMVFLGWQRDERGDIVGVDYWSSQPWTDGLGRASTTIGIDDASFDRAQVYLARARCPTVTR